MMMTAHALNIRYLLHDWYKHLYEYACLSHRSSTAGESGHDSTVTIQSEMSLMAVRPAAKPSASVEYRRRCRPSADRQTSDNGAEGSVCRLRYRTYHPDSPIEE